jgi:hypothetical protein
MKAVVRTLTSLSTEQDVQQLSDANGTSIVSSHYTGERTTIKPIEKEEVASIRCVMWTIIVMRVFQPLRYFYVTFQAILI